MEFGSCTEQPVWSRTTINSDAPWSAACKGPSPKNALPSSSMAVVHWLHHLQAAATPACREEHACKQQSVICVVVTVDVPRQILRAFLVYY